MDIILPNIGETVTEGKVIKWLKQVGDQVEDGDVVCEVETDKSTMEVPTTTNPVGAKGGGECGTVGSVAAAMNAILDALSVLNIKHLDLPATPQKIWEAINDSDQLQNF